MKIEAGKYYRTRDGRRVGPIVNTDKRRHGYDADRWPFCINNGNYIDGASPAWRADGTFLFSRESPADLVAEWPDTLQLRAGKFYRTRDGHTVGPLTLTSDSAYPFRCDKRLMPGWNSNWTADGHFVFGTKHGLDLVAEEFTPAADKANTSPWRVPVATAAANTNTATPYIVAVTIGGKPAPNSRPFVHPDRASADAEARRLSIANPGQEFAVYQRVGAVITVVQTKEVA